MRHCFGDMTRASLISQSFFGTVGGMAEARCFVSHRAQAGGVAIAYDRNFNYVTARATFMARRRSQGNAVIRWFSSLRSARIT
jgi:hypothetical protein